MAHSTDSLIADRVAQLEVITARRNELLRQMYYMIQRRHEMGAVFDVHVEDDIKFQQFSARFDIMNGGSITNASDAELFNYGKCGTESPLERVPEVPREGGDPMSGASQETQVSNNVASLMKEDDDDDRDELDLFGSPSVSEHASRIRLSTLHQAVTVNKGDGDHNMDEQVDELNLQDSNTTDLPRLSGFDSRTLDEATKDPAFEGSSDISRIQQARQETLPQDEVSMEVDTLQLSTPNIPQVTGNKESDIKDTVQMGKETAAIEPPGTNSSITGGPMGENVLDVSLIPQSVEVYPMKGGDFKVEAVESPPSTSVAVRRPIIIVAPLPATKEEAQYQFDIPILSESPKAASVQQRYEYNANYTLPPLKSLPAEFNRKVKSAGRRKREKERDKAEGRRDKDTKDEWFPMGLNRWAATINANPVWKKVSRASKCLSTREWAIAMMELRLIRTLDRIDTLKDGGRWSFRQPKKQRGVGGLTKSYWDYLMDEMKWMRTDFREERKWKLAMAYNLSTAVLEWHSLNSWDERIAHGVCVKWKASQQDRDDFPGTTEADENMEVDVFDQSAGSPEQPKIPLLEIDYGSDEEDEDEREKDSVVDTLEPGMLIEDAFNSASRMEEDHQVDVTLVLKPKQEDMDDSSILQATHVQEQSDSSIDTSKENIRSSDVEGLKPSSIDPLLGSKSTTHPAPAEHDNPSHSKALTATVSQRIREQIAYSNDDKLFLDHHDLDIGQDSTDSHVLRADLNALFPDLHFFGLLDLPSTGIGNMEGKKKSDRRSDRDDPNKRIEETTYTKLYPAAHFMHSKPTLLGTLQPSLNWKNGHWQTIEEIPVIQDLETASRSVDESGNELFDSRSSNSPGSLLTMQMQVALLKDKDSRKRGADHLWSANDDILLRSLIDKYPNNWPLIADCFNSSRLTTATDRRTYQDCLERWKEKWGSEIRQKPSETGHLPADDAAISTSHLQMTTRGVKRLVGANISSPSIANTAAGSEPKKRKHHILVQESIRKAAKKRADQIQKMAATQRKPSAIHETHSQYSKMPKLTPIDLSRMKAEKDVARDMQESVRKRQEDLTRQTLLREQAQQRPGNLPIAPQQQQPQQPQQPQQQLSGSLAPQQQPQPQQQLQPQQQQHQQVNQTQRPSTTLRGQVNISRMATPTMRLSPQQMIQVQQARAAVAASQHSQQAQGHALVQAPVQGQTSGGLLNANLNGPPFAHDPTTVAAHVSSPRNPLTTAVNSPRLPNESAQNPPNGLQVPLIPGHVIPRPPSNLNGHYFSLAPGGFTQEQVHTALRLQMLQAQAQAQAQVQAQQAAQSQQNQGSSNFSS